MSWTLRVAEPEDAERIVMVLHEGFEGYRSFAPAGWEPPDRAAELDMVRRRLPSPEVWCLLAEADGEPAGLVSLMPASQHRRGSDDSALAHLWQLFVRPDWWGSGLATTLHREALREAAARGFAVMRLFAAEGQLRARRFYEREGWAAVGDAFDDPDFGMPLVEYRRAISISV